MDANARSSAADVWTGFMENQRAYKDNANPAIRTRLATIRVDHFGRSRGGRGDWNSNG
jgi:hypothetical protein